MENPPNCEDNIFLIIILTDFLPDLFLVLGVRFPATRRRAMTAVSPEVIKKTQDSLGMFVKKPPLTEKLLNKPPFRFLHDVFSVVIRDRGVLEGNWGHHH